MILLPPLTAKVLQKVINMCYLYSLLTFSTSVHPSDPRSFIPALTSLLTLTHWRPQGSCRWGPLSPSTDSWMCLQFSIPLTRPFLKLPVLDLCGSPDSLTAGCQTLVPCPPRLPGLQTQPLLSFPTPPPTDFSALLPLGGYLLNLVV